MLADQDTKQYCLVRTPCRDPFIVSHPSLCPQEDGVPPRPDRGGPPRAVDEVRLLGPCHVQLRGAHEEVFHDRGLLPPARRGLHRSPRHTRPAAPRPRTRLEVQPAADEGHEYRNGESMGRGRES